jgi:2-C-methyl-D-erythritol 4-phosphate cytidylyltransferase
MASPKFDDASAAPARLPQWRSATAARSHGRNRPDWALIVPIPASIAANREVLFTHFGDTVALVHCLHSRLVSGRRAADAVIAVAESLYTDVEALLAAHGVPATVEPVPGRGTREQCLSAGLARLDSTTQYVLVHDIHRALASTDLADRILDGLRQGNDVVVPALAMVDSVKTVDSAGTVIETVDRARLWSAQFPRGFHREHLATILDSTSTCDDFDELIVARRAGMPVTAIDGDPDAFAIEIPRDVGLADAIYTCRLADQR